MPADSRKCPNCYYTLEGLPQAYTCPECGIEYDEDCTIIRLEAVEREYTQILLAIGLLALYFYTFLRTGFERDDLYLLGLFAVLILMSMLRISRAIGGPKIVVMNRKGVEFRTVDSAGRFISWSELEHVRLSLFRRRLIITGRRQDVLYALSVRSLGGPRAAKRCISEINRRRSRRPRPTSTAAT
jgi:hypothetical protein